MGHSLKSCWRTRFSQPFVLNKSSAAQNVHLSSNFPWNLENNNKQITAYVDPSRYENIYDVIEEFTTKLDPNDLTVGPPLGGGEFADVYKGTLKKYEESESKNVAIKMLKVFF